MDLHEDRKHWQSPGQMPATLLDQRRDDQPHEGKCQERDKGHLPDLAAEGHSPGAHSKEQSGSECGPAASPWPPARQAVTSVEQSSHRKSGQTQAAQ